MRGAVTGKPQPCGMCSWIFW